MTENGRGFLFDTSARARRYAGLGLVAFAVALASFGVLALTDHRLPAAVVCSVSMLVAQLAFFRAVLDRRIERRAAWRLLGIVLAIGITAAVTWFLWIVVVAGR